jgi:hypothetical protein
MAAGGALVVLGLTVWQIVNGFTGGHGIAADLAVGALMAAFAAAFIYGSCRAIDGMYAAGVLRGRPGPKR